MRALCGGCYYKQYKSFVCEENRENSSDNADVWPSGQYCIDWIMFRVLSEERGQEKKTREKERERKNGTDGEMNCKGERGERDPFGEGFRGNKVLVRTAHLILV